jgi:hypothetical protein
VTEAEWLSTTDTYPLLNYLEERSSDRKRRLLGVACCRRIWHRMTDPRSRMAVEMTERFIEGQVSEVDLEAVSREAEVAYHERAHGRWYHGEDAAWVTAMAPVWKPKQWPCLGTVVSETVMVAGHFAGLSGTNKKTRKAAYGRGYEAERTAQAHLIRDIYGNPFRPVAFDPRWRTADTLGLARGVYEDRAFDRLPLLADALMDAGCADAAVLGHCRSDGLHTRGCWVVDLVLGKE